MPGRHTQWSDETPGLTIVEESVHLVRGAPLGVLALYYLGTLPFVLGLLYFWADMSQSAFAHVRCGEEAVLIAGLFLWMKGFQTLSMQALNAHVRGGMGQIWTMRGLRRIFVNQALVQPSGLLLLPLSILAVGPFCWVYAFYQNVTALDDGRASLTGLLRDAWAEAARWPKQNHVAVWLLCPLLLVTAAVLFLVLMPLAEELAPDWSTALFIVYAVLFLLALAPLSPLGMTLAVNIGLAIQMIPQLAHTLFGLQFHAAGALSMMDSTFFAVTCGITYLCMDPFMKAVYVLRCFRGRSLHSGEDLLSALRSARESRGMPPELSGTARGLGQFKRTLSAVLFCLLTLAGLNAAADDAAQPSLRTEGLSTVQPTDLDASIDRVIRQREYAWRLPRAPLERDDKDMFTLFMESVVGVVSDAARAVMNVIRRFAEWLSEVLGGSRKMPDWSFAGWQDIPRGVMIVLLVLLTAFLGYWLGRWWIERRARIRLEPLPSEEAVVPDLEDEKTTGEELPEEGWLAMARDLAARGEYRLALRALFLAALARLDYQGHIHIARSKSNREYLRELRRRAHAIPDAFSAFERGIALFECVWYGAHPATRAGLDEFQHVLERMAQQKGGDNMAGAHE